VHFGEVTIGAVPLRFSAKRRISLRDFVDIFWVGDVFGVINAFFPTFYGDLWELTEAGCFGGCLFDRRGLGEDYLPV
jgi:hypothetical protein